MSGLRILHVYPKDDYFTGAAIQLEIIADPPRACAMALARTPERRNP